MKKTISTKEAIEKAKKELGYEVTGETIRDWCEKYKIGSKVGGRFRISESRLNMLLSGKTWKLLEDEADNQL